MAFITYRNARLRILLLDRGFSDDVLKETGNAHIQVEQLKMIIKDIQESVRKG